MENKFGKVKMVFNKILLLLILISCNKKSTVYLAEKNNIVLVENNGIIEGYTIHPHYTKYSCHLFFAGKNTNSFDTAKVYLKSNDSLTQLENKSYGYFIFKKEGGNLLVKYKTSIIGCTDWIFPKSNDENSIDTIKLKKIGEFSNSKITFVKEKKQDKYKKNTGNYFITYDHKSDNAISFYWEQDNFKINNFVVNISDCIVMQDTLRFSITKKI